MAGANYTALITARLKLDSVSNQLAAQRFVAPVSLIMRGSSDVINQAREVSQRAQELTKVTIKWGTDEQGKRHVIESIRQFKNELGEMQTIITPGKSPFVQDINRGTGVIVKNLQQQIDTEFKLQAIEAKRKDTIDAMVLSADKFLAKSKNMTGKEAETARNTANNLKELAVQRQNAFNAGDMSAVEAYDLRLNEVNRSLEVQKSGLGKVAGSLRTWGESLGNAIKQTISYSLSIGLIQSIMKGFQEGINYLKELNVEMTKIQVLGIEGASSMQEINNLAMSYNKLAGELGTTTTEVAKGSVEWLRQGKTIEETQKLLISSTQLAKLGNLDAAQSTEYLTAITNAYKMSVEDTEKVVDKLVAVDNIAATSSGEIATALRYTAVSAQQAGVSFDELVAYVSTVSSVTRGSAESIGQSFKTMFARMSDIKKGVVDEDGLGINAVETSLHEIGVPLRDAKESFRNMGDVLKDVAAKWNTLTEVQQNSVAKSIAGIRQRETFLVLMANMDKAEKYERAELNATGLATERYGIYLESAEAKQNKMTVAIQKLWQDALNSSTIGNIYDIITAILKFTDTIGGLPIVIFAAVAAMIIFNQTAIATAWTELVGGIGSFIAAIQLLIPAMFEGAEAMAAFNAAANINPYVLLITAIIGLGIAAKGLHDKIQEGLGENQQAWEKMFSGIKSGTSSTSDVLKTYEEGIRRVNKAHEDSGIVGKIFIDKQELIKNGLLETQKQLMLTATSLDDYIAKLKEAAILAGYQVDEQGRLYKSLGSGRNAYREYLDGQKQTFAQIYAARQVAAAEAKESLADKDALQLAQYAKKDTREALHIYSDFIDNIGRLNKGWEKVDLAKMFGFGNETDAKAFFADMANEAATTANSIAQSFAQGKMTSQEYQDSLGNLLTTYKQIFQSAIDNKDTLGLSADAIASISENMQQLDVIEQKINATKEVNIQLQNIQAQMTAGNTALSLQQMETLANAIYASGIQVTDSQGNVLRSAQEIMAYMQSGLFNYANFASQISALTSQAIANAGTAINTGIKTVAKAVPAINIPVNLSPFNIQGGLATGAGALGGGGGSGSSAESALLKMVIEMIKQRKKAQKDALENELENYKKIIEQKKEELKLAKEEQDYLNQSAKKNKDLAKIKSDILILSLDNSEEAKRKRTELEQKASDLEETINKDSEDRKYTLQIEALDKEEKAFEENIKAKIKKIDEYLSQTGRITSDAMKLISNKNNALFNELIAWNKVYGDGLDSTVLKAWNNITTAIGSATTAVSQYASAAANAASISASLGSSTAQSDLWDARYETMETHHSGGWAGGLSSNETFAKLLKGEYIASEKQMNTFINTTIPKIKASGGSSQISLSMPITVAGNLDKTVIPDIETIVNKAVKTINDAMKMRGIIRPTSLTSI